ncbi:MAG: pitrilysin family protein [Candidatus Andersenbacteria bacterium]|nr:pitrilysin family protein [bacterium]MDZ4225224.1 pitrilysin family protein [Candidatus Andersenbacteria bacterium]
MSTFKLSETVLPNGLRAVLLPRRESETVTFLVLVGVGSRYETPRQAGLSHFLEHMFFKGTEKRPTTQEIAEAIDNVGGEFNAFTGEEYTGYYVKVAAKYLARGADVVADILLRPLFPPEEIERERGVIMEEMKMYTETPMRHVWHLWNQALFGNHPLGRRIDGKPETVGKLQKKDFVNYTHHHYHTGNVVVAVAGMFDEDKTKKLLAGLFDDLAVGEETKPKPVGKRLPVERVVFESRPSLDQTHLLVGVPGVSMTDERRWAAGVLSVILGGGMSSRLFIQVRERRGLAYAIRMSSESLTDTGMLVTQAGVRTDKAPEALKIILEEYDRAMNEPPAKEELNKAKQMMRGQMLIEMEETNSLAAFAGAQKLLVGKIQKPDEVLARIDAVQPSDVQRVAGELLTAPKRALALLGPQKSAGAFMRQLG